MASRHSVEESTLASPDHLSGKAELSGQMARYAHGVRSECVRKANRIR